MCNHYYQNEVAKVRVKLKNIGTADVNTTAALPVP